MGSMKILTAEEMGMADRLTGERFGVPSLSLMENAGRLVAQFVLRELPGRRRITVLCGKGNNGGDGMVAARHLAAAGCEVRAAILGDPVQIKGDARKMLEKLPFVPLAISSEAELAAAESILAEADLFLDAVVGTGFQPPLRGLAAAAGEFLLRYPKTPVVAVDLPSGWNADSRELAVAGAYRADAVVTFTAPKLAHAFGMLTRGRALELPGNLEQGPIVVAPIGSPEEAVSSATGLSWTGSAKTITDRPRSADSNKGKFGHVLVIGGSWGKSGAPAMASLAALRTGAGLVTAAIPESALPTVAQFAPELMTTPLAQGKEGEIAASNVGSLDALLDRKSVVAVGPGMGQSPETVEFLLELVKKATVPMVLDADALNILAAHPGHLDARDRLVVLTPHPGEMARLISSTIAEVESRREQVARDFALRHRLTLVLKGWRTLVAHPDGAIAVNTTGNPGMAKGGSGDILTGIVAAMIAQYPRAAGDAVNAAVYLHGLAADFAVRREDQHFVLATDTVSCLGDAFRFRPEDPAGYVWLQGLPGSWGGKQ
jgi:NAD(P)H-hydrate epimerase